MLHVWKNFCSRCSFTPCCVRAVEHSVHHVRLPFDLLAFSPRAFCACSHLEPSYPALLVGRYTAAYSVSVSAGLCTRSGAFFTWEHLYRAERFCSFSHACRCTSEVRVRREPTPPAACTVIRQLPVLRRANTFSGHCVVSCVRLRSRHALRCAVRGTASCVCFICAIEQIDRRNKLS